jgi:hypothetical protein
MPSWLIWVIVIVVVVVAIAAVVSMAGRRRTAQHRTRAEELRTEATGQAGGLTESQRAAEEAKAKADLAQAEAERAREQASSAEQSHQVEQASYEDKLREADRLDPDVDTRSKDYQPSVWNDETTDSAGSTSQPEAAATHRATPETEAADGTAPASMSPTTPAEGETPTRTTE